MQKPNKGQQWKRAMKDLDNGKNRSKSRTRKKGGPKK